MTFRVAPAAGPRLKALFFDFDGVILESVGVKTDAFRLLFARHRRHLPRILRYHRSHAGVSRFVKFDHIHRRILRKPFPPAARRRLGRLFERLVYEKVLACPAVPGALGFLRRWHRRLALFVVSGTPAAELRRIVRRRRLARYFRGVYGTPPDKARLTGRLLRRARLAPAATVFVGDSRTDWLAARRWRIPFVARVPRGARSPFPAGVPRVRDFAALETLLIRRGAAPC